MAKDTGTCLCGSVSITADFETKTFGACHCGMCRKWAGGPGLMVNDPQNIKFKGEENITVYDSSAWAQRGFCKKCGTHLFYRLKQGDFINFPLGLFPDQDSYKFRSQIFTDRKPKSYDFANKTENMTEAEVFAKFAPPT